MKHKNNCFVEGFWKMALSDYTTTIDFTSGILQAPFSREDNEVWILTDVPEDDIPEKGILTFTSKSASALIQECNPGCLPAKQHVNLIGGCHYQEKHVGTYSSPCGCGPKKSKVVVEKKCDIHPAGPESENGALFELVAYDGFYKCDNCKNLYVFYDLTHGLPLSECEITRVEENTLCHHEGEQVLVCAPTHFNFCDGDLPSSACDTVRGCLSVSGILSGDHLSDRGIISLPETNVWEILKVSGGVLEYDQESGTFILTPKSMGQNLLVDDGVKKNETTGVISGNYVAGDFIEMEHVTSGDNAGQVIVSSTDDSRYGINALEKTYSTVASLTDNAGSGFVVVPSNISRVEFRVEKPIFLNNPHLLETQPYRIFYDTTMTLNLDYQAAQHDSSYITVEFDLFVDGSSYGAGTQKVTIEPPMSQKIDYVHVQFVTHPVRQLFRFSKLVEIHDVERHILQLAYKITTNDTNLKLSTDSSTTNILYV